MTPTIRKDVELRIIKRLLTDALSMGYNVSHYDGEGYTLERSTDLNALMKQLHATDEENLIIRSRSGQKIGSVFLVYGNDGHDVIADYTDTDPMAKILEGANNLADRLSR